MKSDIEIAKFVYHKVKGTELERNVTGKLSDRGRPNKSEKEDIVISVLANEGCGQIQRAYVNVNIYVKDLWNEDTKQWERDTVRVGKLCELCKFLFSIRRGDFHTVPSECNQKVHPTGVSFEDGHTEHFINNKLYIEINNE
ncbi:hypothetical protein [Barnesiella intestinihominis]|jgi:hypothetical protein|uniref:hypothetical protein n=1 Tax=Barnesiella intestinihominis TaxID=487174 RepID=UPI00204A4852|nr:MAG TPA: hypothetical protein [Caudoviricetes sp.]